jgi:hypothetical protein
MPGDLAGHTQIGVLNRHPLRRDKELPQEKEE